MRVSWTPQKVSYYHGIHIVVSSLFLVDNSKPEDPLVLGLKTLKNIINLSKFRMSIKNSISILIEILNSMFLIKPRIMIQGGVSAQEATKQVDGLDQHSANQYLFGFLNYCKNLEDFAEEDEFDLELDYQVAEQRDATRITPVFNNANAAVQKYIGRLKRPTPVKTVLEDFRKVQYLSLTCFDTYSCNCRSASHLKWEC